MQVENFDFAPGPAWHIAVDHQSFSIFQHCVIILKSFGGSSTGAQVEHFDFAPGLAERIAAADLVISHAGAGSLFEVGNLKQPCFPFLPILAAADLVVTYTSAAASGRYGL